MTDNNTRIENLRRRVQADPASIAFAALAEEYRRAGRFEEAIETCHAGLKRHPSYLSARVTLGRALIGVGRFDEAEQELQFVLKTAPENLAAIRGMAEIHHRRGDSVSPAEPTALEPPARPVEPSPPPAPPAPASEPPPAVAEPPIEEPPPPIAFAPYTPPTPEPEAYEIPARVFEPVPVAPSEPRDAELAALEAFLAAITAARTGARTR